MTPQAAAEHRRRLRAAYDDGVKAARGKMRPESNPHDDWWLGVAWSEGHCDARGVKPVNPRVVA